MVRAQVFTPHRFTSPPQLDHQHLSAKGNRAAYDGIIHTISEHFEDMLPGREEMPKQVPDPW